MTAKRVLVDMSCTLLHHGHVRLLEQASKLGLVVVALTSDREIRNKKGYDPELGFDERKEILLAIRHVSEVIESPWLIDDEFVISNNIDILVHGDDNSNLLHECEVVLFPRTEGISSSNIRQKCYEIVQSQLA